MVLRRIVALGFDIEPRGLDGLELVLADAAIDDLLDARNGVEGPLSVLLALDEREREWPDLGTELDDALVAVACRRSSAWRRPRGSRRCGRRCPRRPSALSASRPRELRHLHDVILGDRRLEGGDGRSSGVSKSGGSAPMKSSSAVRQRKGGSLQGERSRRRAAVPSKRSGDQLLDGHGHSCPPDALLNAGHGHRRRRRRRRPGHWALLHASGRRRRRLGSLVAAAAHGLGAAVGLLLGLLAALHVAHG